MRAHPEHLTDAQLIERLTTITDDLIKEIRRLNEELEKKDIIFKDAITNIKPTFVYEYCDHCIPK
jgi:hypothetical protein